LSEVDVSSYTDAVAVSSERVLTTARLLDDAAVAHRSLLPGWNRAMVLTHLARNADGAAGVLAGARRGEVLPPYPHGPQGRAADIEAGRDRGASQLLHDLETSVAGLEQAYAAMSESDWEFESRWVAGRFSVWRLLISRWEEVEVHHVDLDLAYTAADWPDEFVRAELDAGAAGLNDRLPPGTSLRLVASDGVGEWYSGPPSSEATVVSAPAGQLLAWVFGRPSSVRDAPTLGVWH
jgi:maleylpyruvate isomerase